MYVHVIATSAMDERLIIKKPKTCKSGRVVKPPKNVLTTSSDDDQPTRRRSSGEKTMKDRVAALKEKIRRRKEEKNKSICSADIETTIDESSSRPCSPIPITSHEPDDSMEIFL